MRTSGALICSLSIVTIGFLITYKLVAKSKQIRDIIAFINSIEQSIKYKKDTLYNIINGLKNDETYSFLFNSTNKIKKDSFYSICYENKQLFIDEDQKKTLFDFLCGLGKTDLQGQMEHCNTYREFFEKYLNTTDEKNESKIKLYPSLFILSGMLVFLILF